LPFANLYAGFVKKTQKLLIQRSKMFGENKVLDCRGFIDLV